MTINQSTIQTQIHTPAPRRFTEAELEALPLLTNPQIGDLTVCHGTGSYRLGVIVKIGRVNATVRYTTPTGVERAREHATDAHAKCMVQCEINSYEFQLKHYPDDVERHARCLEDIAEAERRLALSVSERHAESLARDNYDKPVKLTELRDAS